MQISRRGFLKYCIGSAAALGLPLSVVGKLEEALAADKQLPKVVWLAGANCTGCTVSLANRISSHGPTDLVDLLTGYIDLAYHPNLMGAAGDAAVDQLHAATAGDFILAVEGGIPTAFSGHACMLWTENGVDVTAMKAVQDLAPKAAAVLSIGTCASHGGIPAGNPNPTGIKSVSALTGLQTVNIPGCPTHPDWIVWTNANLLAGDVPALDSQGRPQALYQGYVHSSCPYRSAHEAEQFGLAGSCLEDLGCKGKITRSDCPSRKWNGGVNWCIGAGSICLGCTESGFPDSFSPFYREQEGT
ncbi:MAG: hydrogenase small subunit, partial [Oceanisphaera sp.]|nr:hydrogenase small subunit [Oceanisphaera sp.]